MGPLLTHGRAGWHVAYLNLGTGLALGVVAVWLFQRASGSVWPVLILEGTAAVSILLNWAGDGFGADPRSLSSRCSSWLRRAAPAPVSRVPSEMRRAASL